MRVEKKERNRNDENDGRPLCLRKQTRKRERDASPSSCRDLPVARTETVTRLQQRFHLNDNRHDLETRHKHLLILNHYHLP